MSDSRRMRRMRRNKKKLPGLMLTSLMDVFTILVFFLLFNSGSGEVLEAPQQIKLPESIVETKPKENTVVITVSNDIMLVQGEPVISTAELLNAKSDLIAPITERLKQLGRSVLGAGAKPVESKEVTILADKKVPFSVLRKVMATCTNSGYGKISLAVIQKEKS